MENSKINPKETARIFSRSLSCSRALLTTIDRGLGFAQELEERAAHPLAGGMMHHGHQCGMLWGSTLAAGAESFRRFGPSPQAEAAAIIAAERLIESFGARSGAVNCFDITGANFLSFSGMLKYMFTGKAAYCTRLAVKWAPEAMQAIESGLSGKQLDLPDPPISCASLAARKMGANDAEAVMAAGFAGGIGLSGNACGALGAAVWITTLGWYRDNPETKDTVLRSLRLEISSKIDFYPSVNKVLRKFKEVTGGKMSCREIAGRQFETIPDHADFLHKGGCADIIEAMAEG